MNRRTRSEMSLAEHLPERQFFIVQLARLVVCPFTMKMKLQPELPVA